MKTLQTTSALIFLLQLTVLTCQKAINLIPMDDYLTCGTGFTGRQFNYKQLGGIKYIKNEFRFSMSGILLLTTYTDATDDVKDISLIQMTYNSGNEYLDANLNYKTLQSKVLSLRLKNKKINIYASQRTTLFPSPTITQVMEKTIYANPQTSILGGKNIYFFLSVNIKTGEIYFCHQISGEEDSDGCHINGLIVTNPLIANFNDYMNENIVLNFGYDKDFSNYCYGITDFKFVSGFYSSDTHIIQSFHGGERVKKAYWKFDEISSQNNGIADQWRRRSSQSVVNSSFIVKQQLNISGQNFVQFMDSQMNEMKSHTISFWLNVKNTGGVSFTERIIMQRIQQRVPIFTVKAVYSGDITYCLLKVILYDSNNIGVELTIPQQFKMAQDYYVSISIYQLLTMQKVQLRLFIYRLDQIPSFIDMTYQMAALYPRGGLESDPVNNYFQIGSGDNQALDIAVSINELSLQSGHSLFQSNALSQFYIADNCELSIGIINPACILCKDTYFLNHLDGKCYLQYCLADSLFQAENRPQRVCELCDSSCTSKSCTSINLADCLPCPEGYNLDIGTNKCNTICGDGLVRGNEECDVGATSVLGCSSTLCKVESTYECINYPDLPSFCSNCGDGKYDPNLINEQCDYVLTGLVGCTNQCKIEIGYECNKSGCYAICGDGIVGENEQCDDGNTSELDGCNKQCLLETNYICYYNSPTDLSQTCKKSLTCGDGILGTSLEGTHLAETCDDGNNINGDGCSSSCQIESNTFTCSTILDKARSVCTPICGDSKHVPNKEECDVGNIDGIGCKNCKVVQGYSCIGGTLNTPDTCSEICGDGIVVGTELCDVGLNSKICLNNCRSIDPRWICTINTDLQKSVCTPVCGDGKKFIEECDDGNNLNGDGCNSNCKVELSYTCTGGNENQADVCKKKCEGFIKECDDGNIVDGDGCTSECQVEKGFVCMKQAVQNAILLPDVCFSICGDGILTSFESCDDGNSINGDGCSSTCTVETGYVCNSVISQQSLQISLCKPKCGDAIKLSQEECDDGNNTDLDGCSYDCKIEPEFGCIQTNNQASSICMPCTQSTCLKCDLFYDATNKLQNICKTCDEEYYLDSNNVCQKCSENCLSCSSDTACLQCATSYVLNNQLSCQICSEDNGYFYNTNTQECIEICGDGIRVGVEECDDGNVYGGDGCNKLCTIEYGYKCESSVDKDICWRAEGSLAYMLQDEKQTNILRIYFEDEVIIKQTDQWQLQLPFLSKDSFTYTTAVIGQSIQITIAFKEENPSLKGQYAIFYFIDLSSVKTKVGEQELSQKKINALLKYDYNVNQYKISDGSIVMIVLQVFIYIATLTFILSFLASVVLTSAIPFWTTIEYLQTINLLQYQNVQLPHKLNYFLTLFNFANLRLIGDMKTNQDEYLYQAIEAPSSFQKAGLNNLFLFNFIPICIIWIIVFSIYVTSKVYLKLKNDSPITMTVSSKSCLRRFMINYHETFKYNIIVRTLIFIFTPLSLITLLQVRGSDFESPLTAISTFVSYGSLFVIVSFPLLAYHAIRQRYNQIDSQIFFKKFGSLLFGLNLKSNVSRVFNVQNTIKKLLLSLFLVGLHDNPVSQSALISILGCINLGLILYFSPKQDDKEQTRVTFGEICLSIIHCCYIAFAFDDQTYRLNGSFKQLIGWFVIILIMFGYLIEVVYLVRQIILHIKSKAFDKHLRQDQQQLQSQNNPQLKNINRVYKMQSKNMDGKQLFRQDNL